MKDPIREAAAAMVALLESNPTTNEFIWGVAQINAKMYEEAEEAQNSPL